VSLHCPEITEVWHPLGEMLRLKSSFPLRLSEFTILLAARGMDCDYVFNAHMGIAVKNGLPQAVVDAMAKRERPGFVNADEEAVYDYCTELTEKKFVSDKTYARALELFGAPGVVELTALLGYYTMVAMTVIAHEMPLPAGAPPPLTKKR
jgi:4-carboxymuconolactone decarboxylase